MKTYESVVEELDAKIPRDCVALREGGGGRKLSYLEGHYVINRLNKVLGQGNWAYTSDVTLVDASDNPKGGYSVHYIAKVRLAVTLPGTPTEFTDYGYGDGSDKFLKGKAHELAVKEAVTDGLKRCAKNLGMSLGLALYDKTQENVQDEEETKPSPVGSKQTTETGTRASIRPRTQESPSETPPLEAPIRTGAQSEEVERKNVLAAITAQAAIAVGQKKRITYDALYTKLKNEYGVETKDQLDFANAKKLLSELNALNQS